MDFGRVPAAALPNINFTLPSEPAGNSKVLPGKAATSPKIYVGCPRWSVKEWDGKIYPKGLPASRYLEAYTHQYNTIELNATHYNLYTPEAIKDWVKKAEGQPFLFCPKVYNGITHEGSLSTKGELTAQFLESVAAFENHLGPVFMQLSDSFGPNRGEELFIYLSTLSTDLNFFVELRHPAWFTEARLPSVCNYLYRLQKGLLITDAAGRRDCCHMHLTTQKIFVRFVGNNLHPTDYVRIDDWVERIHHWLQNGLSELYFIIHMPNETFSPELSIYLIEKLNTVCGLSLKKLQLLQPGLFD